MDDAVEGLFSQTSAPASGPGSQAIPPPTSGSMLSHPPNFGGVSRSPLMPASLGTAPGAGVPPKQPPVVGVGASGAAPLSSMLPLAHHQLSPMFGHSGSSMQPHHHAQPTAPSPSSSGLGAGGGQPKGPATMADLLNTLEAALRSNPGNQALQEALNCVKRGDIPAAMDALKAFGVRLPNTGAAAAGSSGGGQPALRPASLGGGGGMAQAPQSGGLPPPTKKRAVESTATNAPPGSAAVAAAAANINNAGSSTAANNDDDDAHPSFEDATDVTKIAGVNLDEEEELLNESTQLGSRVSGPMETGPTPAQLFDANALATKLRALMIANNMQPASISPKVLELLQEALFERLRGVVRDAVSIARHRTEATAFAGKPDAKQQQQVQLQRQALAQMQHQSQPQSRQQPLPRVVSSNLRALVQEMEEADKRELERKAREEEQKKLQILRSKDLSDPTRIVMEQAAAQSTASAALAGIVHRKRPTASATALPGIVGSGDVDMAEVGGDASSATGTTAQKQPNEVFALLMKCLRSDERARVGYMVQKLKAKQLLTPDEEREFSRYLRRVRATGVITRRDLIILIERDLHLRTTRLCWELTLGMPLRLIVEGSSGSGSGSGNGGGAAAAETSTPAAPGGGVPTSSSSTSFLLSASPLTVD